MAISLTLSELQTLAELKEQARWPDAYRFLADIAERASRSANDVESQDSAMFTQRWLESAIKINGNDGSGGERRDRHGEAAGD